ncbi:protein of unknown function [Candidatus Hydrogenisulfobacillus filiaventi]|uniref:Mutator family transposase n=1 Tax=Candidatus Hydrogenisulfobacillus filiaventi TaxID=2707344 RepID=A0A6F8ZCU6_9FIRM|nr:protein of unknown function [Candidatus Hydrogenisulfobacillus filiaventi]
MSNCTPGFPAAGALLDGAAEDILVYMAVPTKHGRQLHSTNPLERLNRELARRCDVIGIFPNAATVLRLAGAVLLEQQDEWATVPRRSCKPDEAATSGHKGASEVDGEAPSPLPGGLDSCSRGSLRVRATPREARRFSTTPWDSTTLRTP